MNAFADHLAAITATPLHKNNKQYSHSEAFAHALNALVHHLVAAKHTAIKNVPFSKAHVYAHTLERQQQRPRTQQQQNVFLPQTSSTTTRVLGQRLFYIN
jgi:hypothetical protein